MTIEKQHRESANRSRKQSQESQRRLEEWWQEYLRREPDEEIYDVVTRAYAPRDTERD